MSTSVETDDTNNLTPKRDLLSVYIPNEDNINLRHESVFVNPWARPLEKFYEVSGPLDQGRILAHDAHIVHLNKTQKKINALKKLLKINNKIGKSFFEELTLLERKYNILQTPYYEVRRRIVNDGFVPLSLMDAEDRDISSEEDTTYIGVPHFWLRSLLNAPYLANMIESYDIPVLSYITDMRPKYGKNMFGVDFEFGINPYFTNSVLAVTFNYKYNTTDNCFAGINITGCKGCRINWRAGQDVTVTIKRTRRRRIRKAHRPSFFQLFQLPCFNDSKIMTGAEEIAIRLGYGDVVLYLLDRFIPRAVLYFTKDALNSEIEEILKQSYHVASGYKGYVKFFKCGLL